MYAKKLALSSAMHHIIACNNAVETNLKIIVERLHNLVWLRCCLGPANAQWYPAWQMVPISKQFEFDIHLDVPFYPDSHVPWYSGPLEDHHYCTGTFP